MAEMASMYPVSGGQYYWVALLAPKRHAKFLSWMTGWLSTLGWQSAASTGTYLGGNIIQALLVLNIPDYEPKRWQGTLIMYAVLALTLLVNTYFVRLLPRLEGVVMILHIVGFFAVLIPIVHFAPISSNAFVWKQFTNISGYTSNGTSWLIGQAASAILFIGYDGACHMAEEVENAAMNVPRAMFFTIFVNGVLGFAAYIFILYCFGDPEETLGSPYGQPFIQIFNNALQSKVGTTVLTALLITLYVFATFGFVASASRQTWAFSRDNGLPLSKWLKRVRTYSSLSSNIERVVRLINA
jgi:choline transport protein